MKDVLFVMLPNTLLLDLAGPAEAFRLANQQLLRLGKPAPYRLRFVGPQALVNSSVGMRIAHIEALPERLPSSALVVLLGQPTGAQSPLQQPLPRAWSQTRHWLAQVMVVYARRGPDEPELSPLLSGRQHLHPAVHRVQNAVSEKPAHD